MKWLEMEAKTEKLADLLAFIDEELLAGNCSMKTRMQIDMAVEEIFVNVASYAYAPASGPVKVGIRIKTGEDPAEAAITFIDHGAAYNPLEKEDPDITLPAGERPIGGLGIFMVKKVMDDIQYEYADGQNILTICKKLK